MPNTSRPLPENLRRLYQLIGKDAADQIQEGHSFTIDGVEFVTGYRPESTADRFYIVKSETMLAYYEDFLTAHRPTRIMELGIAEGGSTAMLALRPDLERLVAIDNEENRLPALDQFVAARGLGETVRTHFGIDQSDRQALTRIVEADFADGQIDLVIDDASHAYDLTRSSFDILFPHVRPGGWYLIEDWAQHLKWRKRILKEKARSDPEFTHQLAADWRGVPKPDSPEPLYHLALELTVALGTWPEIIDRVEINHLFVAARRGPEPLDPDQFQLAAPHRSEP